MKLPSAFEEKMRRLLGEEYEEYVRCFEEPRYYGLRVNTRKISPAEFAQISPFALTPVPWIPNGYYYDGEQEAPARHPYYFAGLYYLQEPSAMTPASRLPVEPGDRVLDVCAAPGGKATELGAQLQGRGVLAANDISSSRARGLLKNIELFGIPNPLILCEEPGRLTGCFSEYFDKILIDAPCSGEGMFRKDRRMVKAWEEHGPAYFARIQRSIILQAAQMLRPGGMMLYSTCTFDPEENEGTVQHLLTACPEFQVIPMEGYAGFCPGRPELIENGDPQLRHAVRIYPHRMKGEGHFLALLQKGGEMHESAQVGTPRAAEEMACNVRPRADGENRADRRIANTMCPRADMRVDAESRADRCIANAMRPRADMRVDGESRADRRIASAVRSRAGVQSNGAFTGRKSSLPEELTAFLEQIDWQWDPARLDVRSGVVYYLPEELPSLRGIRLLRSGLLLGELKKNRFEPSQALAMALRREDYAYILDLPAGDERADRYLRGETLEVGDLCGDDASGWYLVCTEGYPLGWGKLSRGSLKNKYLPGWRKQSA